MPLLGVMPRFAPAVEDGSKTQTIRAPRKTPIRVGDTLYAWTGPWKKGLRRKLGEFTCTSTERIHLYRESGWLEAIVVGRGRSRRRLNRRQIIRLAKADGFDTPAELFDFFNKTHELPFVGDLIKWKKDLSL